MSYDAFAADENNFYYYSELRGLSRAEKGILGNWKKVAAVNQDCKHLRGVSLIVYGDLLLLRHSD